MDKPNCQTCNDDRLVRILARVPASLRLEIGKVLKLNYGLGPGSAVELPMHICLDCGTVQGDWPLGDEA